MIIRKQTDLDIDQLEVLFMFVQQKTFTSRSEAEFLIGDYIKSMNEDEVWVADENGVILGFVSTYPSDNFLHNLFVHPDAQGKNIGTQLLRIAEDNLEHPMTAKIAMDNLKVCGFYEKNGWFKVSIHEDAEEPYVLYKKI